MLRPDYGNKRDYRKIDIFHHGVYLCSTTWAKTCKEAKDHWLDKNPLIDPKTIVARYSAKA